MVEEARLEQTGTGLGPTSEGWFVVNVRDARWMAGVVWGAAGLPGLVGVARQCWAVIASACMRACMPPAPGGLALAARNATVLAPEEEEHELPI